MLVSREKKIGNYHDLKHKMKQMVIPVVNGALMGTVSGQDLVNGCNCYGCPTGALAACVLEDHQNHEKVLVTYDSQSKKE